MLPRGAGAVTAAPGGGALLFGALPLPACAAHRPGTGAVWAGGLRVLPGGPFLVLVFVLYRPGLGASWTPVVATDPGAHPMPARMLELAAWLSGTEGIVLVTRIVARACCRGSASATPLRLYSCR